MRRTLQAALTLALALVLLFLLVHVLPGDPLAREGDRALTPQQIEALRARYGLDRPLAGQLLTFLGGLGRGDLGTSIEYGRPVTGLLLERLPATLLLGGTVLLLNFTLGLWLGVRQAVRKDSREDRWLTTVSLAGYATPSFWLGLVLAGFVGVRWRLLPPAGMRDPLGAGGLLATSVDVLRHLILPALTLSIVSIAGTMRFQRSAMLEVLRLPYIVTARAKGVAERAGDLAARLAQRAVPGVDPVRPLAADRWSAARCSSRRCSPGLDWGPSRPALSATGTIPC